MTIYTDRDILVACGLPFEGVLGPFTFKRNERRSYWVVNGPVPLGVARKLYDDPIGRSAIRVAGHCDGPPPQDPWLKWRTRDGRDIVPTAQQVGLLAHVESGIVPQYVYDALVFTDDRSDAIATVETYHIDTDLGLSVFARELLRSLPEEPGRSGTQPDLIDMVRELGRALGYPDLPARPVPPSQVWAELLSEVSSLDAYADQSGERHKLRFRYRP